MNKILSIIIIFLGLISASFGENRETEYYSSLIRDYLEKARFFTYKSNDSLKYYSELALKTGEESGSLPIKRDTFYEIGYIYARIGMLEDAFGLINKSKGISVARGDSIEVGKAINQIGYIHWNRSKHLEAKEAYITAINIHQKYGDKKELGRAKNNLANLYRRWGDYEKSIKLYLDALDCYIESGFTEGVDWLQFSMSLLYKRIGEPEEALKYVKNSLKMYTDLAKENKIVPV